MLPECFLHQSTKSIFTVTFAVLVLLQTHSLTQRRAVPGRSRLFDELLAEHKGLAKEREALKEKEREAALRGKEGCGQSNAAPETASPSKTYCPAERPLSSLKLRLANAHIPR